MNPKYPVYTDELYQGDGRLQMARSLQQQHPDVVRVIRRFHRWQHYVDYRPFKHNKLIRRDDVIIDSSPNDYGLHLVMVRV